MRLTQIVVRINDTSSNKGSLNVQDILEIETIPELEIPSLSTKTVSIPISLGAPTALEFTHIEYLFHGLIKQVESLTSRGRRLYSEKRHRLAPNYTEDLSLRVRSIPSMARLFAMMQDAPNDTFQGTCERWKLMVSNTGSVPISKVWVTSDHAAVFVRQGMGQQAFLQTHDAVKIATQVIAELDLTSNTLDAETSSEIVLQSCFLHPGEYEVSFDVFYQAGVST